MKYICITTKGIAIIALVAVIGTPIVSSALVQVDGYYRDDGTYVEPHYRSEPDGIESNNLNSDGLDIDNDGYGAGPVNETYSHEIDPEPLYDSYHDTYHGSSYDSLDTYDDYGYESSYDSYDYGYESSYDSYEYGLSY